jgi:hypothetical protein
MNKKPDSQETNSQPSNLDTTQKNNIIHFQFHAKNKASEIEYQRKERIVNKLIECAKELDW